MDVKMVICVRRDLKMRRGKEIAQGSHAAMQFILTKMANHYSDLGPVKFTDEQYMWLTGAHTKITLQVADEAELLRIHEAALVKGLTSYVITDAGRTEFGGVPTKTCLAIGPNESKAIDEITKDLKLY